jgi:hypothetical protein
MAGLMRRLNVVLAKGEAAPPRFWVELPDEWAGGYGPAGYVEALVSHARAHPEDHDRAFELLEVLKGAEGLFVACAVRGPFADLIVTADDMQPGGVLSHDDELDAWVEGNLDVLAADDERVGDPIVSTVHEPYAGRELRWSRSYTPEQLVTFASYCFATAGRVWTLEFSSEGSSPSPEAFRTIATSFSVD